MEQIITNMNLLNRSIEGVIAVSKSQVMLANPVRLERSLRVSQHCGGRFMRCSQRERRLWMREVLNIISRMMHLCKQSSGSEQVNAARIIRSVQNSSTLSNNCA